MAKKQKFPHLVGSKWTSCRETWGWRHFQVVNRKNEGQWVFAEMVSSCDPTVRFWLNAHQLKDRTLWQPGWKSLDEQANLGIRQIDIDDGFDDIEVIDLSTIR